MSGYLALLLVQASWSYEGGQGLGFLTGMLALSRGRVERDRVWQKYRGAFNTNPYLAAPLTGIATHYERKGSIEIDRLFGALQSGFGSSGDSFFWGALRPGLAVLAVTLAAFRPWLGPVAFFVPFVAVTQAVRVSGLAKGLALGKQAAIELPRRLSAWGARLDVLVAFLLGALAFRTATVLCPVYMAVPVCVVGWSLMRSRWLGSYLLLFSLLTLLLVKLAT
jgi:mannose/fructose/N-acetylgalactosamine-specific phosphotransferase system component IID